MHVSSSVVEIVIQTVTTSYANYEGFIKEKESVR